MGILPLTGDKVFACDVKIKKPNSLLPLVKGIRHCVANAILSHHPLTPSSGGSPHKPCRKNPYHFLAEIDTDFIIPSGPTHGDKVFALRAHTIFRFPHPRPIPKGGEPERSGLVRKIHLKD